MNATDAKFLRLAYEEALAGFNEGGCPIGSVLALGDKLIAQGRNQRVQAAIRSRMAKWIACAKRGGGRITKA